jgi:hypothetical protein
VTCLLLADMSAHSGDLVCGDVSDQRSSCYILHTYILMVTCSTLIMVAVPKRPYYTASHPTRQCALFMAYLTTLSVAQGTRTELDVAQFEFLSLYGSTVGARGSGVG